MVRYLVAPVLLGALALCAGCQTETDSVATGTHEIKDGTPDTTTSVCAMFIRMPEAVSGQTTRRCTCTRIGERVVITAASCVQDNLTDEGEFFDEGGDDPAVTPHIDLRFGDSFTGGTRVRVADVVLNRYNDAAFPDIDLALILLADDPPGSATIAGYNADPARLKDASGDVRLVGYGISDPDANIDNAFGALRAVTVPLSGVDNFAVRAGSGLSCAGDGGGPVFFDFGDGQGEVLIAVTGALSNTAKCPATVSRVRVDKVAELYIQPVVDALEGPCPADDTCDLACGGDDPDCPGNECMFQNGGVEDCVETGCAVRDLDCELGVFPGDACADTGECELGGECVAAADDATFTYCDMPCDVELADDECPAPLSCNASGRCEHAVPSPGSQGFPCTGNSQCRSGICEEEICVTTCDSDEDCADPYTCQDSSVADGKVCLGEIVSGGGGFCTPSTVAGRGKARFAGTLALMLFTFALVLMGRRKRR